MLACQHVFSVCILLYFSASMRAAERARAMMCPPIMCLPSEASRLAHCCTLVCPRTHTHDARTHTHTHTGRGAGGC